MGGIFEGLGELAGSTLQGGAEREANRAQYIREQRQANAAIQTALERGAFESGRQRMAGSQLVADQGAAYTASGVDATQGTAAAVQADTKALSELDAQTVAINAAREAWGLKEAKAQSLEEFHRKKSNSERNQVMGQIGGFTKYASSALKMGMGK